MPLHTPTRRDLGLLILILLIAAFLRLNQVDALSTYRFDAGTLSQLVLEMNEGKSLPLLGIASSAGVPNSPMTVYLLAPLFALNSDPFFVIVMIALWNVIGVGLLWGLAARYISPRVAHVAALAYAVSPYAIHYSSAIWAQDYHTPLILLAWGLGLYGFVEGKRWAQVLCLPILVVAMQVHFAAWTLMPVYLWMLWLGRRHISWIALIASLFLSILVMIPFIMGIRQQPGQTGSRFETISGILQYGVQLRTLPIEQVIDLTTGRNLDSQTLHDQARTFAQSAPPTWPWGGMLVFAGLGLLIVWRKAYRPMAVFIWLWLFSTLFAFIPAWTGTGVYHHYFIPTIPVLMLCIGLGVAGWTENSAQQTNSQFDLLSILRRLALACLGVILILQSLWIEQFKSFRLTHLAINPETTDVTATPVRYMRDVRAALAPYNDVLIIGGDSFIGTDSAAWKGFAYAPGRCVRDLVIAGGNVAVLPDHPFAVLVASYAAPYSLRDFYTQATSQVIPLRPGEDRYTIYTWDAAPEWTETTITPVSAPVFENGIRLTGYSLVPQSIYLQWHIDATGSRENVQYFAHFFNAAGDKIGQRDTSFYDVQYWCAGDTIITRVDLDAPIPEGTVKMSVGMYRLVEGKARGLSTIDASGQPSSGTIDIAVP